MNKSIVAIFFSFLSFLNWSQTTTVSKGKRITITGIAVNLKAGATIKDLKHSYYIEKLDAWPKASEGQEFTVKGRLIVYTTIVSKNDPPSQYVPIMYIIRRARIHKKGGETRG